MGMQVAVGRRRLIAGITPVYQSPVVGVWEDGHLTAREWGWKAFQLLAAYGVVT
jgi:hypothetical protein